MARTPVRRADWSEGVDEGLQGLHHGARLPRLQSKNPEARLHKLCHHRPTLSPVSIIVQLGRSPTNLWVDHTSKSTTILSRTTSMCSRPYCVRIGESWSQLVDTVSWSPEGSTRSRRFIANIFRHACRVLRQNTSSKVAEG